MLILVGVIGLNVYLFAAVPKGFFPQQDTGQLNGGLRADQSISFQAMPQAAQLVDIIDKRPGGATRWSASPAAAAGGGFMFVNLKPRVPARTAATR